MGFLQSDHIRGRGEGERNDFVDAHALHLQHHTFTKIAHVRLCEYAKEGSCGVCVCARVR